MAQTVDKVHVFGLVVGITLGTALPVLAHGITERVNIGAGSVQSNDFSYFPVISADGRFVAFESYANNLVLGDTNGQADVFCSRPPNRQDRTREREDGWRSGQQLQ